MKNDFDYCLLQCVHYNLFQPVFQILFSIALEMVTIFFFGWVVSEYCIA